MWRLTAATLMILLSIIGISEFFSPDSIWVLSIFFLVPIFFFFVTLVHELGHLIAARAFKNRLQVLVIGAIGYDFERERWFLNKNFARNEVAGFVICSPRWPINFNSKSDAIIYAAGPLFTFLLGVIFVYCHTQFGQRVEYYPGLNVPVMTSVNGEVFGRSDGLPYTVSAHSGYLLLAAVCFIDAFYNLLPIRQNDGANIIKAMSPPFWTPESWALQRLGASIDYEQELVSNDEWLLLRQESLRDYTEPSNFENLIRFIAWNETDPEAFVAIVENGSSNIADTSAYIRMQFIVCSILADKPYQNLAQLMPDKTEVEDENLPVFYMANALLAYKSGSAKQAIDAANLASEYYLADRLVIPDEELDILTAIKNGKDLPVSIWPSLNA